MALYKLTENRKHKKFQLYKRLTETGLLDSITDEDFKKHDMTKNDVITDVENNYSGLLDNLVDSYEDEGEIVESNKAPVNFTWTDKNRPLTQNSMQPEDTWGGECYIYDNTTNSTKQFEELRKQNSYPKAINNISSTCKTGNDNFKTHNNKEFAGYFEHVQGTIRPITDRTLDAWFDVGLDVTMYQSGIPFTATGFQKAYYVWYIKGDGTDYPYLGQVGYIYPGQEANYPYKYRSVSRTTIKGFTYLHYKGSETPFVRNGQVTDGFYAKLQEPNKYAHGVVKVNLNKLATLGQKWHYQGFTVKSYPVFDIKPSALKLEMKGDDVELDITDKIETSLTWEFEQFTIESSDPNICKVEHNWVKDPTNPKYYVGPSYIKLIGNGNIDTGSVDITVTAVPKGTTYKETFTFKVDVEQLYRGTTYLDVTPNPMIVRVNETLEYTVTPKDQNYNVSSNVAGLIRVYKGKITGVKVGKGVLNFYAQAAMSRPKEVNIPYRVDAYVPDPKITPKTVNINVELGKKTTFSFETNCPRANLTIDRDDFNVIDVSSITWAKETKADSDPLNVDYPISTGTIEILGKKIATTKLYLTGYVAQNDNVLEISITVNVLQPTVDPEDEDEESDKLATLNETDVYWGFHDQAQGQFTYLRSKTREDGLLKNKIYVIPKPTEELLAAYPEKEFNLALVEDLTKTNDDEEDDTPTNSLPQNPNYLDWKEKNIPEVTFDGQPGTVENETYISTETLELFRSQNVNVDHKHWVSSNGVMVGDVWYKHQGEKGFGVGPAPLEVSTYYGLTPLPGCWDPNSINYGNYQDIEGNVMVYIPRHYVAENYDANGKMLSINVYYPVTMDYSNHNSVTITTNGMITDKVIRDRFNNDIKIKSGTKEYEEIKNKLILPRCFINENKVIPGIFVDKYPNGGYTLEPGSANFSKKDAVYFGTYLTVDKTTGTNQNDGKIQPKGNDLGIMNLFSTVNRAEESIYIDNAKEITYFNRRGNDMSFITPFVRNMLNRLAIAHAYGCNTLTTPNNCAWLNTPTGFINNVVKDRTTSINNVSDKELALGSHNGQACGVYGLNTNILEACIGAYQTLTGSISNNTLNGFNLTVTVETRNLDITALAKNYATTYTNATETSVNSIPSHISGRQPDNGNGYGMTTFANKGFKGICLLNNQQPTGTMLNIKDNVPASSVWDLYNSNSCKYNLGFTGSFVETAETATELTTDINKYTYNSRMSLDHALININLGDHKIKYYTGCEDEYTASDIAGGLTMNFIPLYGGVLENKISSVCVPGTKDKPNTAVNMRYTLASTHAMSCTWFRLGYDPANNKGNVNTVEGITTNNTQTHTYFLPVATRRMIIPDITSIAEYVNNGTYGREMKTLYTKSYNTFGSKLLTKETNDPWSE